MDARRFDALTRALATGTSRRQALKGFAGAVMGLGLLGPALSVASAAPAATDAGTQIAQTSADLLARMPNAAAVAQLPSDARAASETLRQILVDGAHAQGWNAGQVQAFQARVTANIQQHEAIAHELEAAQQVGRCDARCALRFVRDITMCRSKGALGRLLCDLIVLVEFDVCEVLCILQGI